MVLTRATNRAGTDGVLGTADDVRRAINTTTPFVDQNQTYTSHPSHQVFLREYELRRRRRPAAPTGRAASTAPGGGIGNWAEVKAQADDMLGIQLTDTDVVQRAAARHRPLRHFLRGPNGFPQLVIGRQRRSVEGDPSRRRSRHRAASRCHPHRPRVPQRHRPQRRRRSRTDGDPDRRRRRRVNRPGCTHGRGHLRQRAARRALHHR